MLYTCGTFGSLGWHFLVKKNEYQSSGQQYLKIMVTPYYTFSWHSQQIYIFSAKLAAHVWTAKDWISCMNSQGFEPHESYYQVYM